MFSNVQTILLYFQNQNKKNRSITENRKLTIFIIFYIKLLSINLEKTLKKAGLHRSFSRTEIMINNNKINKKLIEDENRKIKTTKQFKYLGEKIIEKGSDIAIREKEN